MGDATAEMLASACAKVTLFDMNVEAGDAHARKIGGHFARVNVSEDEAVRVAVDEAEAAFGVARILVNCAGIAPASKTVGRGAAPHALNMFRRLIEVNLIGTFNVIREFAAKLHAADPVGENAA